LACRIAPLATTAVSKDCSDTPIWCGAGRPYALARSCNDHRFKRNKSAIFDRRCQQRGSSRLIPHHKRNKQMADAMSLVCIPNASPNEPACAYKDIRGHASGPVLDRIACSVRNVMPIKKRRKAVQVRKFGTAPAAFPGNAAGSCKYWHGEHLPFSVRLFNIAAVLSAASIILVAG